jgi:hypothetical protein
MRLNVHHWFRKRGFGFRMFGPFTQRQAVGGSLPPDISLTATLLHAFNGGRQCIESNVRVSRRAGSAGGDCAAWPLLNSRWPPLPRRWALSIGYHHFPANGMTICVGQSTGARCDFTASAMPFEPGQEGRVSRTSPGFTPLSDRSAPTKGRARIRVTAARRSVLPAPQLCQTEKETAATLRFLRKRGLGAQIDQAVPANGTRITPERKSVSATAGRARLCCIDRGKPGVSNSQSKARSSGACCRRTDPPRRPDQYL